jgi:hypothetical protein
VQFPSLDNGGYFVRAGALAPSEIEGQTAVFSFRRQRVGLKADLGQVAIPGAIRVNWLVEGEGQSRFRFQLLGPGDAAPLVDEAGLERPGITLTGLGPGTYRWRVGVIQTVPEGSAEVWTPLQTFTVSP